MKPIKGKNFLPPDKSWLICEYGQTKQGNHKNQKKYYVRKFNRELRQFFRKMLRGCKYVAED